MEVEKFVEIVRENEILWNLSHPQYKNLKRKMVKWKEISQQFGIPSKYLKILFSFHLRTFLFIVIEEDCNKKWKTLRDGYNRELSKRKVSGQGADELEPKWKYLGCLEFLRDHLKPRP